jgi:FlaA1/EpsC-like NDP-sugar epimerase
MRDNSSFFEALLGRMAAARVAILFLFHAVVFTGAYVFSFLLRFEFAIPTDQLTILRSSLLVVVGVQLLFGIFFGFYRGWWRYVGMADVVRLVFGITSATAALVALWYIGTEFGIHGRFVHSPRGVLMIDWAFSLLALFGARTLIRLGRERFREGEIPDGQTRVLIVGAGDAGETLAREIQHRPQLGMKVVGFVDDHRAKWGAQIRGIKVSGPISSIGEIADSAGADQALIAIPSATGKRVREIVHHLSQANLKFKTIPGIDHLVTGKVHVSQLRPVNMEDLLRRQKIELPGDPVRQMFKGKRVLVTGAGGTIGSELCSQILEFDPESLLLVERSEYALYEVRKRLCREFGSARTKIIPNLTDVCDADVMERVIEHERPEIVLHAAAHKHVPLGETNAAEYVRNNTIATHALGKICARKGVERFVFISTDKAINPASVMGATKRAAEILLLDLARECDMKVTVVRFGNVIGSSGSVIPLFMEQIAAGGPVTVTHPEVTRYFIRTSESISLVLQAATLGSDGQIFMLDMGDPIKIVDLARDLIRLSNHTEDEIPIIFTGLRPGEKLFEEIALEGESYYATLHPQILVTTAPQPTPHLVARWLRQTVSDPEALIANPRAALKELIPESECKFEDYADQQRRDKKDPTEAAVLQASARPALRVLNET